MLKEKYENLKNSLEYHIKLVDELKEEKTKLKHWASKDVIFDALQKWERERVDWAPILEIID